MRLQIICNAATSADVRPCRRSAEEGAMRQFPRAGLVDEFARVGRWNPM
jgi:methylphosphotriester-DNA--protein-cysteine methyltransferase